MSEINLKINGREVALRNSLTIEQMLHERGIVGAMFVVEKNLEIIQKENYDSTPIAENDKIEIVGFFGGG